MASRSLIARTRLRRIGAAYLVGIVALLLLSSWVRIATVSRYLPFTDYPDELNMFMLTLNWRGAELGTLYGAERVAQQLGGYPPLFVWESMAVQTWVDAQHGGVWLPTGAYLLPLRLIAMLAGVLTTACLIGAGWLLAGRWCGLLAGLVWALAPAVVEYNSLAIPDPLVYLGCAAALYAALRAWRRDAPAWVIVSLVAGLLAIFAKFTPINAVIPAGLALLYLLVRNVRRTLPWLGLAAVVSVLALGVLIATQQARPLANNEANNARSNLISRLADPTRNLNNWRVMVAPIGAEWLAVGLGIGVVGLVASRRRSAGWAVLGLLIYALPGISISALVSDLGGGVSGAIRHVLPVTLAFILLWAAGLTQALWWLQTRLSQFSVPRYVAPQYTYAVIMLTVLLLWGLPSASSVLVRIAEFKQTHVAVNAWRWSDANLPANDGLIQINGQSFYNLLWNRPWSGYDGVTSFNWWYATLEATRTSGQLASDGIAYVVIDEQDQARIQADPALQQVLSTLTLVKQIASESAAAGQPVWIYRARPPQVQVNIAFGKAVRLVGYDLSADLNVGGLREVLHGESLRLRPYWRMHDSAHPAANYSLFIHLYAADAITVLAQTDGPLSTPDRPTLTWDDPAELYIGQPFTLTIPPELPAGRYRLAIGVYDYLTGARRPIESESSLTRDFYEIPIVVR